MTDRESISKAVQVYLSMVDELVIIRRKHDGADSDEEDKHLEAMDVVWYDMSQEECNAVSDDIYKDPK